MGGYSGSVENQTKTPHIGGRGSHILMQKCMKCPFGCPFKQEKRTLKKTLPRMPGVGRVLEALLLLAMPRLDAKLRIRGEALKPAKLGELQVKWWVLGPFPKLAMVSFGLPFFIPTKSLNHIDNIIQRLHEEIRGLSTI